MARYVSIVVALVVLASAGAWEFAQSNRRADSSAFVAAQQRLDTLPDAIGGWTGKAVEYDAKQAKAANARAYTFRRYMRDKGGDAVDVLILVGDPGEIGTHDPERCYGGAGFRQIGQRIRREFTDPVTAQPGSLWTGRFDTETYPAVSMQVNWGWTADGAWTAADDARFEFVGKSVLYKLYLTRRLTADGRAADDPTAAFLTAFLPELRKAIAQ